ncbi:hypothetical protein EV127DRAFT_495801 [Xylaria flabelliformis]|nr:hypothetical protein EV127DRAFT_495801 [Xylaria flabelliformis]
MATHSSVDKRAVEIPDPIDKLKHLTKAARNNPNQWVCEACISAHEIKPTIVLARDIDGYIFKSCPLTIEQFNKVAYNTLGHRIDPRHRKFDHRHVQLALKWTRLRDPDYKPMLDAIMHCHVWKSVQAYQDDDNSHVPAPLVFYRAAPKIVRNNGRLKFLLKFGSGPSPINRGVLSHSFMTAGNKYVFRNQTETKFACENCATDYTIVWGEEWIELIVWQDFGPEVSPGDGLWRSQCVDLLTPVIHEPGTITRMYEELPAETPAGAPENVASSRARASSQAGESTPADASSQATS